MQLSTVRNFRHVAAAVVAGRQDGLGRAGRRGDGRRDGRLATAAFSGRGRGRRGCAGRHGEPAPRRGAQFPRHCSQLQHRTVYLKANKDVGVLALQPLPEAYCVPIQCSDYAYTCSSPCRKAQGVSTVYTTVRRRCWTGCGRCPGAGSTCASRARRRRSWPTTTSRRASARSCSDTCSHALSITFAVYVRISDSSDADVHRVACCTPIPSHQCRADASKVFRRIRDSAQRLI